MAGEFKPTDPFKAWTYARPNDETPTFRRRALGWMKGAPARDLVIYSLIISAAVFLLLSLLVYPALMRSPLGTVPWWDVDGLSSAIAASLVIGGGVFAIVQVSELVDNNRMQVYKEAVASLVAPENIEARRWIYQNIREGMSPEEISALLSKDENGSDKVKIVLNSFDYLGFLMLRDWGMSEAMIDWMSPMVVKVWRLLGDHVRHQAEIKQQPDYYRAASYLGHVCTEWRRHAGYPDEAIRPGDRSIT